MLRDVGVQVSDAGVPTDIVDEPRQKGEESLTFSEKRRGGKVGRPATKLDLATRELPL